MRVASTSSEAGETSSATVVTVDQGRSASPAVAALQRQRAGDPGVLLRRRADPRCAAWATSPASSSAVKTVFTASAASIRHSRSTCRAAHFIATSSGLVARQKPSIGGPSQSTARSGPARVRFFGTISPTTVCRKTTTPSASRKRDRVDRAAPAAAARERRLQQVGQGRLGDRAQAERADR